MAVRTNEELMQDLRTFLGEDTSDESLALIENLSDTLNNYSSSQGEDWKKRYEENDQAWKKRYRERFFSGTDEPDFAPQSEQKRTSFDSLFK